MKPRDVQRAQQLNDGLIAFSRNRRAMRGIQTQERRSSLIEQILESIHRVEFPRRILSRDVSPLRANPQSDLFDPLKAAILRQRAGQVDEAFWFIFLFVHFGKHLKTGWRLARDVYGRLGEGEPWTWAATSHNVRGFRAWLDQSQAQLKRDGTPRHFGNHRKYESLDAWSGAGTGGVVESYVAWVLSSGTHAGLVDAARGASDGSPAAMFDYLYQSMNRVHRFGRMAKFDYLTMLGKLRLAPIEPGSAYLHGATGPLRGARLLFDGDLNSALSEDAADDLMIELGVALGVGMQVLEDAICNWQKSPDSFIAFRG